MKARDYLEQIAEWEAKIRNKEYERKNLYESATAITPNYDGERVQSSSDQQTMANKTNVCVDIDRQIEDLKRKIADVIATIEMLPKEEYELLHNVYVKHMDLTTAAEAMDKCKSYSWARGKHGSALQHLQTIIDRRGRDTVTE